MDIMHPGREYTVLIPQVGPIDHQSADGVTALVEALEAGGAKVLNALYVPGIDRVQIVDITSEREHVGMAMLGELPTIEKTTDRAKQTKAFGT